ncbi:HAD family hydrolase [Actinomadura flavalba]|uniref:HAD family hydrolase n=1 Tax=Actinomadura flavalba TaxID=1120938 RepID=UPI000524FCCF|nr:HAD family phosphatase [Actinomadura flavalba]
MGVIPVAGVAFDLDGTLVNTEPRNRAMWTRLFRDHDAPHDDALIASFAGRRAVEVLGEHVHLFPGRTAEDLFAQAGAYEIEEAAGPVAGAAELVRGLHALGVPLAVVTSGVRDYAEGLLAGLGVRDLLAHVITAEDVTEGKPHPEGFAAAARRLGVPPGAMVAFEDAPAGVAAAKAAGMTCVGVTTTQPPAALVDADRVVVDLTEIELLPGPALRVTGVS